MLFVGSQLTGDVRFKHSLIKLGFSLKKEANMTPKQFFDFGEAGLRNIGFFKKGWIAVGDDGSVTVTNTGE
jgi:hypothetical protein